MIGWTLAVALAIGIVATFIALPAAWCMRSAGDRWLALLLTPLLLPSYLVYAAWGTLRGPGSVLGDWIGRNAGPEMLRTIDTAQAIGGLALWAWPLAALVIGTAARRVDGEVLDALALSGAGRVKRIVTVLSLLRGSIVMSVMLIGVMMLGSAIPLHVARVPTYAIEVWRALDETAGSAGAWRAALPLVVPSAVVAWVVGGRLAGRGSAVVEANHSEAHGDGVTKAAASAVWMLAVGVPCVLLVVALKHRSSIGEFFETSGPALWTSLRTGALVAGVGVVIAVSTAVGVGEPGRVGWATRIGLRLWLAMALAPGLLVGSAVVSAGRVAGLGWVTDGETGVWIAHVARFGAVAALAGWWCARCEPAALADVRRLSAQPLRSWLAGPGRMGAAVLLGGGGVAGLLSVHEIEAAVVASPPRPITEGGTLAELMLRLLHFNRDEELTAASLVLLVGGVVAGVLCLLPLGKSLRIGRAGRAAAALLAVVLVMGCERHPTTAEPLRVTVAFGEPGRASGQFVVPRAIDSDGKTLWIVDKSGGVQHLDAEGKYLGRFTLDRHDKGFPCGITCGPDGLIYVADTHENRVSVWRPVGDGNAEMIDAWGTYGTGPGEFIYPTDVVVVAGADGVTPERFYVAEYGGNDRISVFDGDHRFLFAIGHEGVGQTPGAVELRRPQSIEFDAIQRRLVVTDAINHRIGILELDGTPVRWIGRNGGGPGNALGEFAYPYGLELLTDGRALVAEYGNNRVQLVDLESGAGLAIYGESGRGKGQLVTPWGVAVMGETAYVLDTGNARVQGFRAPGRGLAGVHE